MWSIARICFEACLQYTFVSFSEYIKFSLIHMYADDTQLFRTFHESSLNQALVAFEDDIGIAVHISLIRCISVLGPKM